MFASITRCHKLGHKGVVEFLSLSSLPLNRIFHAQRSAAEGAKVEMKSDDAPGDQIHEKWATVNYPLINSD